MNQSQLNHLKSRFNFHQELSGLENFFQSAVFVPLILIEGEYHFIFEKRAATIRQGGEICFPGGKIDPTDETPQVTAIRETCEELGCQPEKLEVLGNLKIVLIPTGAMIYPYVGVFHQPLEELEISPAEVEKIFTVPVSYFMNNQPEEYHSKILIHPYSINGDSGEKEVYLPAEELNLPERYFEPWGNIDRKIYVYQVNGETIWGITAEIIVDFVKQMTNSK